MKKTTLTKSNYFIWENYRKINSSKFINSMYIWIFIVPIFVKLFELVTIQHYNFIIFNQTITIQFELPFSLIIFYFSAIFFALGNVLIKIRIPLIILENNSYSDFENDGKKFLQLKQYADDINYDFEALVDKTTKKINDKARSPRTEESRSIPLHELYNHNSKIDDTIYYFWELFNFANKTRNFSRYMTGIFYAIGWFLFALVLIQNFITIINILCTGD